MGNAAVSGTGAEREGGGIALMRFFLRTGDTAIDSSRRGRKSTLVGDDMVYVVGVISAAASWGSGTVKGGTRLAGSGSGECELELRLAVGFERASLLMRDLNWAGRRTDYCDWIVTCDFL